MKEIGRVYFGLDDHQDGINSLSKRYWMLKTDSRKLDLESDEMLNLKSYATSEIREETDKTRLIKNMMLL